MWRPLKITQKLKKPASQLCGLLFTRPIFGHPYYPQKQAVPPSNKVKNGAKMVLRAVPVPPLDLIISWGPSLS
jgi:hypothetical protein